MIAQARWREKSNRGAFIGACRFVVFHKDLPHPGKHFEGPRLFRLAFGEGHPLFDLPPFGKDGGPSETQCIADPQPKPSADCHQGRVLYFPFAREEKRHRHRLLHRQYIRPASQLFLLYFSGYFGSSVNKCQASKTREAWNFPMELEPVLHRVFTERHSVNTLFRVPPRTGAGTAEEGASKEEPGKAC